MMFRSLDCPCDENKKQSLEIHCFLDCSLFSTVSRNFWIRIYHDKKLGETTHRNGSNSMPASAQTKQAAFLMAIQHWEGESRSWSWQRNDLRTEERPSRFTGWLTGLERNLWAAYFPCMHLPHWGSSHTAYSALVKPYHRQTKLLFLITKPTQNQRLLRTPAKEIPSVLRTLTAVTDNHYMMTGALFEMSLAGLRQGLQRFQHHKTPHNWH